MPTEARTSDQRGLVLITPEAFADMDHWHSTIGELRREAPVAWVEADGWPSFWAVTSHEGVFEVSRRSDVFFNTERSAPGPDFNYDMMAAMGIDPPRTLVHIHGDIHQKYRNVTNDWFKPAAVRGLQESIDTIADEYLDRLVELGGTCDFATDIAVPFTIRVIMGIFGVPREDEAFMLELTQGLFGAGDPEYLGDLTDPFELVTGTIRRFETYFDELTEARRARPTNDLATVIANGMVDGKPLGEIERLWYYIIVATAGHDTTSFSASGGLEQLLRHPDQLRALQEDPSLIVNATEEIIRWTSPVRSFFRWAQEDFELCGVKISKGDVVLTSYPAANRDETVFPNPDEFDIRRPEANKLLSFGLGMHYCLGSQVARREVQTLVRKLLERVDTIELNGRAEWTATHFVSGVKHLPIRYTLK
ncbi:MAG TPA: cytochrome P450 [Acidimicrobiaceae bacterium]|nr:cytochrome P450 [Acidimicrobiaceae bacterium]